VTTSSGSAHVVARVEGPVGHLTLDRPEAHNAIDVDMVRALRGVLDAWAADDEVAVVLLDGAGDRAFCAGGDIRTLYEGIAAGEPADASAFLRAEYALDLRIADYPKPVVAVADGITMGGGVGLACHAAIRVVTERSRLAMPETRIGFSPDVGGSLLLGRAPGRLGEYLALTGRSMDAADAIATGLADHFVPSDRLGGLRAALAAPADAVPAGGAAAPFHDRVAAFATDPGPSSLAAARTWIDPAFAAGTVPEILDRLRASEEPAAHGTARLLEGLSPTGLVVALESVRRARRLDLRATLAQEYGLMGWFTATQSDVGEGIRALLVDKDNAPRWRPASLDAVAPGVVAEAFAFAPPHPLWEPA
jgi:enoyl-CoA hydratase